nr:beta-N-acetylhexosaminidase [Stenoxybacter acetivorans]
MTNTAHLFLPRGPVMADVAAFQLTEEERQRLSHPAIGGVILFRRNYASREQITALIAEIKSLRTPALIVAVDHEGGRVQRFIEGFTRLPAMRVLGELWDKQGEEVAVNAAENVGWVLAAELRACGVDLSFTPVLDLDWGCCAVIGNRSFHADPAVVSALALALQRGLNKGGMRTCGKHFPGHGYVAGDSHFTLPEDNRGWAELWENDIRPFQVLSDHGMAAVMPAHVVYSNIDDQAAGFSRFWLQDVLRKRMGFDGVIFSDDLTMEGASGAGDVRERARLSFEAGCDVVLVCNKPDWTDALIKDFAYPHNDKLAMRWQRMEGEGQAADFVQMMALPDFQAAQQQTALLASPNDLAGGVKVGEAF